MQVVPTCGQFLQKLPLSLSMSITCSFFYQIKNFFHLWISQEENYKMFWTWTTKDKVSETKDIAT
jgi:hypothetical protein